MSWSIRTEASLTTDVGVAIDKAFEANPQAIKVGGPQIEAAKQAALALLTVVARPDDKVVISLSGHYNKDLEPATGWASCAISVALTQVYKK